VSQAVEIKLFRVWLLLSGITLLAWWLGSDEHAGRSAAITYSALLIVAVKVRIIVVEFMEARRSSKKLQLAMDAWLLLLLGALAAIYGLKLDMPPV
jgi:TRAP-type uncharacterized transport system fused permease subunit